MPNATLPEGFRCDWEGGIAHVHLPEMIETSSHVFEPVLSKADAARLADVLSDREKSRPRTGRMRADAPLSRVLLLRDDRFSAASVDKFRDRLLAALHELSVYPEVEAAGEEPRIDQRTPVPADIDPNAETDARIEFDVESLSIPPAPAAPAALPPPADLTVEDAAPWPPPEVEEPAPEPAAAPVQKTEPVATNGSGSRGTNGASPSPAAPGSPSAKPERKRIEAPIPSRRRFERKGEAKRFEVE